MVRVHALVLVHPATNGDVLALGGCPPRPGPAVLRVHVVKARPVVLPLLEGFLGEERIAQWRAWSRQPRPREGAGGGLPSDTGPRGNGGPGLEWK